jgi:hypothetical protein
MGDYAREDSFFNMHFMSATMSDYIGLAKRTNLEQLIIDDTGIFLELLNAEIFSYRSDRSFSDETCFEFARLLFHYHLYKLYGERHDAVIDFFFSKLDDQYVKSFRKGHIDEPGRLIFMQVQHDDQSLDLPWSYYREFLKAVPERDQVLLESHRNLLDLFLNQQQVSSLVVVYLVDFLSEIKKSVVFQEKKIACLKFMGNQRQKIYESVKKKSDLEIWRENAYKNKYIPLRKASPFFLPRTSFIQKVSVVIHETLKEIVLIEKLPYVISIFFAIIGYLLIGLLNDYKDVPVLKNTWDVKQVTRSELVKNYSEMIALAYNPISAGNIIPGKFTDSLLSSLKGKPTYFIHKINFDNISFKGFLRDFQILFFYGDRVEGEIIYGNCTSSSTVQSNFKDNWDPLNDFISYSIDSITMPTKSNVDIEIITTSEKLPFNIKPPDNQEKFLLMEPGLLTSILSSRFLFVLTLIGFFFVLIFVNFVFYVKIKK